MAAGTKKAEGLERLNLESPCPECLGNEKIAAVDPRCQRCGGGGYVPNGRGLELIRFLDRHYVVEGDGSPAGAAEPVAARVRDEPPPCPLKPGDLVEFAERPVRVLSTEYQHDATPHGWYIEVSPDRFVPIDAVTVLAKDHEKERVQEKEEAAAEA
jgi:hypothetical protein